MGGRPARRSRAARAGTPQGATLPRSPVFVPTAASLPRESRPPPHMSESPIEGLREGPGTRIGPYRILEQIGEGGFGVVFLAEQREPVVRQVALKIIKAGMDTRQFVARFEAERQALALMDHPHIARVIDGGATETGRPYFVMELVKGAPIAEYCDEHNLTIAERLELFGQVCDAVQHAHQKGIIHRDLKPSNLLVTEQDGKPVVKVIDFGIAKATSARLTDKTIFTEQQQVVGTLQYMSPEQAEGSLDIDTRTDVYALGVVLYELLTGTTPFDKETLRDAFYSEIQRLIREVDPPKPSTRLSTSLDTLAGVAARRCVEPKRLTTLLRGELDWIVMRALEKDRARRYESPSALALDIRRHLGGEAVVAAPPSAAYRLRKFVRRYRVPVAASGAVAASLVAGVVAFAWQANVAAGERDAARAAEQAEQRERVRAESNERQAAAINHFLLDMLASADVRLQGRDVRVAQVLDSSSSTVGEAFQDRPDVEASVRSILARTYNSLGLFDQAEPHVARALELRRELGSDDSPEYARSLADRAGVESGRGQAERAARSYLEALEAARRAAGPESSLALSVQSDYANCLASLGRREEAELLFRDALAARRRVPDVGGRQTRVLINSLAVLLHHQGRLDEAEALYREALESNERARGAEHPDTLTARMNLGSLLRTRGDLAMAESLFVETFPRIQRVFGAEHPKTAEAAAVLANLYFDQGRIKDSIPLYEESLAILRRVEGERTARVAEAKRLLANALSRMGERARAVALGREVSETWVQLEGPDGPNALKSRLDFANALAAADQTAEAEPLFEELLERCPRVLGPDHVTTIIATNSYAVMLLGKARHADAEPYLRRALEAGRRTVGAEHRDTLITQYNLSAALRETQRLEDAERLGRETLDAFVRVFGPQHASTATAHMGLGLTLARLGRNEEARREFESSIAILKATLGERNPAWVSGAVELGGLLVDAGRADEAEPVLRSAVEVARSGRGPEDTRTLNGQVALARCLTSLGRFTEAETLLLEAHPRLVTARPAGHADIARAAQRLAELYAAWNAVEPDAARAASAAEWQAKAAARD
ncbi:MAG: serine/threonine protein kinase [Planctomycetes bacterium]|nr:serine/threonine protein kinase [Planctomycetota bacterium]